MARTSCEKAPAATGSVLCHTHSPQKAHWLPGRQEQLLPEVEKL